MDEAPAFQLKNLNWFHPEPSGRTSSRRVPSERSAKSVVTRAGSIRDDSAEPFAFPLPLCC